MDFWCHASHFSLSWASEQLRPHQATHARGALRQQLCARPRAHSGFHRAHRETPWRAASALASALSPRVVLVHRLLESAR